MAVAVDSQGKSEDFSATQHALTQLPMAVLADGNSASCSEILTGALKDNHRAQIDRWCPNFWQGSSSIHRPF